MGIEPPQSPESLGETPPRESKQACGVAFAFVPLTPWSWALGLTCITCYLGAQGSWGLPRAAD